MLLGDLLDIDQLRIDLWRGYVSERSHPLDDDLRILNYTHQAAYDAYWTHETKTCRGLIIRGKSREDAEVVARPFKKFFNYGEHLTSHETIPVNESFRVTSKEDGSLGIWYLAPDGPAIATRGSFDSDQARWATEHLRERYGDYRPSEGTTTLVEIIYPANRIVLDYGDQKALIHLATLQNETGLQIKEAIWHGPRALPYHFEKLEDLQIHLDLVPADNREGFVVTFESGLMVKFKFEEYVRLHRILTGLSERRIWEHISNDHSIDEFIEGVPDEFYDWVRQVDSRLRTQHLLTMQGLMDLSQKLHAQNFATRKDLAIALQDHPDRGWAFKAYDGQWDRLSEAIWRALKPAGNVTFRNDDDS